MNMFIEFRSLLHKVGAERLIIDSISSFEVGMSDKVKYTDYIWGLTDYFKSQGVTVLLTHEMHDYFNTVCSNKAWS